MAAVRVAGTSPRHLADPEQVAESLRRFIVQMLARGDARAVADYRAQLKATEDEIARRARQA